MSHSVFVQFDVPPVKWEARTRCGNQVRVFLFLGTLPNRIPGASSLGRLGPLYADSGAFWVRFPTQSLAAPSSCFPAGSTRALEQAVMGWGTPYGGEPANNALRCKVPLATASQDCADLIANTAVQL